MKWGAVLGITFILALMVMYEWPKMNQKQKKERAAFVTLLTMGWFLAFILVFFPDIPGPTELIDAIYKPLGRMLEK
jgi:multisubunit Na+/H+ antiporter MnhB subunit